MDFVVCDFYRSEFGSIAADARFKWYGKKITQTTAMQIVHNACGLFQKGMCNNDDCVRVPLTQIYTITIGLGYGENGAGKSRRRRCKLGRKSLETLQKQRSSTCGDPRVLVQWRVSRSRPMPFTCWGFGAHNRRMVVQKSRRLSGSTQLAVRRKN